jgi:hypothetical protein
MSLTTTPPLPPNTASTYVNPTTTTSAPRTTIAGGRVVVDCKIPESFSPAPYCSSIWSHSIATTSGATSGIHLWRLQYPLSPEELNCLPLGHDGSDLAAWGGCGFGFEAPGCPKGYSSVASGSVTSPTTTVTCCPTL